MGSPGLLMGLRVEGGSGCLTQRRKGAKKKGKEGRKKKEGAEKREEAVGGKGPGCDGNIGKRVNWDGYDFIDIFLFTCQIFYTLPSFPPLRETPSSSSLRAFAPLREAPLFPLRLCGFA